MQKPNRLEWPASHSCFLMAEDARKKLEQLMDEANNGKEIHIASEAGQAVLLAADSWRAQQETLHLAGIPGLAQRLRDAAEAPDDEFLPLPDVGLAESPANTAWTIRLHRRATSDLELCKRARMMPLVRELVKLLCRDPWATVGDDAEELDLLVLEPYDMLVGHLNGLCSRRINRVHRMIYTVDEQRKTVSILALWTHCEPPPQPAPEGRTEPAWRRVLNRLLNPPQ